MRSHPLRQHRGPTSSLSQAAQQWELQGLCGLLTSGPGHLDPPRGTRSGCHCEYPGAQLQRPDLQLEAQEQVDKTEGERRLSPLPQALSWAALTWLESDRTFPTRCARVCAPGHSPTGHIHTGACTHHTRTQPHTGKHMLHTRTRGSTDAHMCVCVHVCTWRTDTHVHVCGYMCARVCTHTHVQAHACMCAHAWAHRSSQVRARGCGCVHVCT